MNIGNKIKTARKSKNMTQTELGRGIVTRNMLSAIESGKAKPSLDTLIKIAEKIEKALFSTLSANIKTADLGGNATTSEFTKAIIENL